MMMKEDTELLKCENTPSKFNSEEDNFMMEKHGLGLKRYSIACILYTLSTVMRAFSLSASEVCFLQ